MGFYPYRWDHNEPGFGKLEMMTCHGFLEGNLRFSDDSRFSGRQNSVLRLSRVDKDADFV